MSETDNIHDALIDAVRRLAAMVAENGLAGLTVEEDGVTIRISGSGSAAPVTPVFAHPQTLPPTQSPAYSQAPVAAPSRSSTLVALESPMVGIFYRSPSPEDPPFVNIGDVISIGQTIGMIEAMKVYSEVPSEVAGRIVQMPVESGKLVQQGQPLLLVETA